MSFCLSAPSIRCTFPAQLPTSPTPSQSRLLSQSRALSLTLSQCHTLSHSVHSLPLPLAPLALSLSHTHTHTPTHSLTCTPYPFPIYTLPAAAPLELSTACKTMAPCWSLTASWQWRSRSLALASGVSLARGQQRNPKAHCPHGARSVPCQNAPRSSSPKPKRPMPTCEGNWQALLLLAYEDWATASIAFPCAPHTTKASRLEVQHNCDSMPTPRGGLRECEAMATQRSWQMRQGQRLDAEQTRDFSFFSLKTTL